MATFGYGLTKYKYATHESALKAIQEKEKKIQRLLKHQNELKTWTPHWAIRKERKPRVKKFVGEIKKEEKSEIKEINAEAKKAKTAVKHDACKWLTNHNITPIKNVHKTTNFLRYRIKTQNTVYSFIESKQYK